MRKLKELIYFHGFNTGICLMVAPILRDLIMRGAREWNLVSIGMVGVCVQTVGLVLMIMGGRDAR